MLLQEPQQTNYDLHFHLLGFHVRVHPFFWLAALVLGANGVYDARGQVAPDAGVQLLGWGSVMFISILVHELGHSLIMRRFGTPSHIILYMLGGLAVPDSAPSWMKQRGQRNTLEQILISLAGPVAGFLLAALTVVLIYLLGGRFQFHTDHFPFYRAILPPQLSMPLRYVIVFSLYINIFWGIINLLPVYPLDGGQVSRALFERVDPWNGMVRSLWLSIYVAVGVAIASWVALQDIFMPLLFISLAANNYMILQHTRGGGPGGNPW